jgi:hypothetical protein
MKKTACMIIFLLAQVFTLNVIAQDKLEFSGDCLYPDRPAGADGSTATEAQMIAFQKDMKDYLAKGNDFLTCLDKEEGMMNKKASAAQKEEFKAQITLTYNAVVDEMNSIADQFNTALRAFKSQNK